MKRTTRLGWAVLALLGARGCTSSPKAAGPTTTMTPLNAGEVCDPSTSPTVLVHFDPLEIVVAAGQQRPARLVVDPDLCSPVTAQFSLSDGTIATVPESADLDLRHPTADFTVGGLAAGTTTLTVSVQRPTDAAPTTGTLSIVVMPDASPPPCSASDSASGTLSGSSTTLTGSGSLADVSLSVPPGAFTRTDELAIPPFPAAIACGTDMTTASSAYPAPAPGSLLAVGPAITFTPTPTPAGPDPVVTNLHSLKRELDFAIPVNPAAMPAPARLRHLQVLYSGPMAKAPRAIPVANPHFTQAQDGTWTLGFESPWFGTYQAAVSPNAGLGTTTRHLTHKAVLGISMGGGGAAIFGTRHHDQFDAIAPLGGNSDLTWLVWYFEQFKFGGFCPVSNPGCTIPAPNLYPLWETYAHTEDFDHWFFQPGGGTGGTFSRGDWTQILEDFSIMGGNPNGQNADSAVPFMVVGPTSTSPFVAGTGVTDPATGAPVNCAITIDPISPSQDDSAALQAQEATTETDQQAVQTACLASRCDPKNAWVAKTGFYDAAYNPDGSKPVISFCDGGQNGTSPYVDTWAPSTPGSQVPSNLTLAVDLNGNGIRDLGEPVIRQGEEPFDDVGTDGKADAQEPGYDPVNNPDPDQDDYDFALNPNGTENDHVYEQGEPFQDVGLDGVPGTKQQADGGYDVGEGDGKFTLSAGAQQLYTFDPHSALHGRSTPPGGPMDAAALRRFGIWADGGVRDMANFAAVANHFLGAVGSVHQPDGTQVVPTAFYNNFENLPGSDPTQPDQFLAVNVLWNDVARAAHLRYGYVDATSQMIANGDGQHVGTGSQILYRLVTGFYFAANAWSDADRTLSDTLSVADPTDPTYNGETSTPNTQCSTQTLPDRTTTIDTNCCELKGHCETYFTGPTTQRLGPLAVTLPPGYALAGNMNEKYPVLFVLHGYGQDPRDLEATAAITDNYMNDSQRSAATRLAKMIVVYVDGRCRIDPVSNLPECIRGTFYLNSNRQQNGHAIGQLDSWFEEVVQYIDANYRTMGPSDVDFTE
ncbi:MAG TPA: hypothetical protein VGG39_31750 [Polyangiaceae bacterium]